MTSDPQHMRPYPFVHRGKIDSQVVKLRRALSINQWNSIATELP